MSRGLYVLVDPATGGNGVRGDVYEGYPSPEDPSFLRVRLHRDSGEVAQFKRRYRPATLDDAYNTTHWLDGTTTPGTGQQPAKPAGRKDDGGKLDYTLLDDMPNALAAVVEVMQWAVTQKKPVPYERGSWQGVEPDRYRAAILRHNAGAAAQAVGSSVPARQQRDEETGLLHLAHQATSALMALESTIREMKRT